MTMINLMLDDLGGKSAVLAMLRLKVSIQIVNFYLLITDTLPFSIQ